MSDSHATFGNVTGPVQTGGGTQYVSGGHQYVTGGGAPSPWPGGGASPVSDSDVTECLRELARHVAQLRLTANDRAEADRRLAGLAAAASPLEQPRDAAQHLEALTRGLVQAGALADSTTKLAATIKALARWLGPLGAGAVSLL